MSGLIPCCIVDDHCDIIPFLQACWRSKKIPFNGLKIIHFDSHADLGLPATKVKDFLCKKRLEEILSTEDGISEFILPLVCCGHFDEINWIYPEFIVEPPFPIISNFHIGNGSEGVGAVTLQHPYYFEDGNVYHNTEISGDCTGFHVCIYKCLCINPIAL